MSAGPLFGSIAVAIVCARSGAEIPVVTPSRASMETVKAVSCRDSRLGRRHLGRDDQVAFVLPVLVVDQDEHAAIARLLDDVRARGHHLAEGLAPGLLLGLGHL
jgi:hypothetical protein